MYLILAAGNHLLIGQSQMFAVMLVIAVSISCLAVAVIAMVVMKCYRLVKFERRHYGGDKDSSKQGSQASADLTSVSCSYDKLTAVQRSVKNEFHGPTINYEPLTHTDYRNDLKTSNLPAIQPLLASTHLDI